MNKYYTFVRGFIISATLTAIFLVALTITAELYAPLKLWLKNIFFHHWIGKSVLVAILFVVLGFPLSHIKKNSSLGLALKTLALVAVISVVVIVLFFALESYLAIR